MIGRRLPQLSSATRSLIEREQALPVASPALKERALERARAALDQDRPSGVLLKAASRRTLPVARKPYARLALLVAAAIAVASLAVAGAGIYHSRPAAPTQPVLTAPSDQHRATPSVVAPPAVAPSATAVTEPPIIEQNASAPAQRFAVRENASRPASIQSYADEVALLEPARSAIARADFAAALSALARHQQEFPRGQLAEEREALRVRALWGIGQKGAAESAAANFRKRHPQSGLLGWMGDAAPPSP